METKDDKSVKKRVWFHRTRAVLWLVAGIASFPLGWAYQVAFVTFASIYANVTTDWGAAEAADDQPVLDAIAELQRSLDELTQTVNRLNDRGPG